MSIPTKEQANRFLAPLRGNLAVLLLHDIETKIELSRFLLRCARLRYADTTVLDADAFYCTNMNRFAEDAQAIARAEILLLQQQDFEVSSLLPLLSSKRELLILDDLNSLYLLATDGRRSHQLTILMKLLSSGARMNNSWVIATAFRTEVTARQGRANLRSLTALGDLLVETEYREGSLTLKGGFNGQWPNDELKI